MTPAERQAMRESIRQALGTAVLPAGSPEHPGVYRADPATAPADLLDRFTRELEALGGFVHHAPSTNAVVDIITSLADREGGRRLLAWDDAALPVTGIREALEAAGCQVTRQQPGQAQDSTARAVWADATVGVTSATACLAQTGSLVVISGPGRGRLVSLLTPIHVAIVTRSLLQWSLPDLLVTNRELATAGANLVCITGPSRTADIEHTLSRGVHGPREVHVIFVGQP